MAYAAAKATHKSLPVFALFFIFCFCFRFCFWLKSYENHTWLTLLTLNDLHASFCWLLFVIFTWQGPRSFAFVMNVLGVGNTHTA